MKKLVLAASAILPLLAGGAANAADMPARAPITKAPPPVAYSWTGLYFGGHLGVGWTTKEWELISDITPEFHFGSGTASGFLGGAQIGANYQVGAVVFGIEADASWANLSGETCDQVEGLIHCFSKVDRFGTVAGRFGIAAERALIYFKGGAAWVHDTHALTLVSIPTLQRTASGSKWGWTAGTGVEYALTRDWSAKLEYDFLDFGTSLFVFDVPPSAGGVVTTEIKQRIHTLKVGLNYKFDWGGPVAASY